MPRVYNYQAQAVLYDQETAICSPEYPTECQGLSKTLFRKFGTLSYLLYPVISSHTYSLPSRFPSPDPLLYFTISYSLLTSHLSSPLLSCYLLSSIIYCPLSSHVLSCPLLSSPLLYCPLLSPHTISYEYILSIISIATLCSDP